MWNLNKTKQMSKQNKNKQTDTESKLVVPERKGVGVYVKWSIFGDRGSLDLWWCSFVVYTGIKSSCCAPGT